MAIITLWDAQLAFGHYPMLDHAEFSMEAGEKIGLIGRNGTGKSSLLQVLAGQMELDDGFLNIQQDLSTSYVEQSPCYPEDKTVFEVVSAALDEVHGLLAEYRMLADKLEKGSDDQALARFMALQNQLDATDAWNLNHRVENILDRLSLNRNDLIGNLSGGHQNMRLQ